MRKLIFMAVLSIWMAAGAYAQDHHYVKTHPAATVSKRPPRPSAGHVWVGSEWNWSNGAYAEAPGHWELPPSGHKIWVAGRWSRTSKGSYWVPGHWS
jgi:hypothetical protein